MPRKTKETEPLYIDKMPKELKGALKKYCVDNDTTIKDVIVSLVDFLIKNQEPINVKRSNNPNMC